MAPENVEKTAQTATAPSAPPSQRNRSSRFGSGGGQNAGRYNNSEYYEKVVHVNRCAKVVKGGRRFNFSALVVVGDREGKVGYGFAKANEVGDAIRRGTEVAKKSMVKVHLRNTTIPHQVMGVYGGGRVMLRPASPGTGVIAGGGVRAVIEASGIRDVLTKSLGSKNAVNVVKATLEGLMSLRHRDEIMRVRGLSSVVHQGGTT